MDDDGLIARVAAGDDGALRELFSRHAPWLAARLRVVLPAVDVEDVLQETFLGVWRGAAGYRPDGTAGGWLWGIARRQAALFSGVTLVAGHRLVAPGQRETGLLVLLQSEVCCLERGAIVTLLAAVPPRSACKLSVVFILVAVHADCKLDLEPRLLTCGRMAGSALDGCVRKDQGKASLRVICNVKRGRAPTLHSVAALAAATVGTL